MKLVIQTSDVFRKDWDDLARALTEAREKWSGNYNGEIVVELPNGIGVRIEGNVEISGVDKEGNPVRIESIVQYDENEGRVDTTFWDGLREVKPRRAKPRRIKPRKMPLKVRNAFAEEVPETILQEAEELTSGPRQEKYGHPKLNFAKIAMLWTGYLGTPITPRDVPWMMILTKAARDKNAPQRDNLADTAGYARTAERLEEVICGNCFKVLADSTVCQNCGYDVAADKEGYQEQLEDQLDMLTASSGYMGFRRGLEDEEDELDDEDEFCPYCGCDYEVCDCEEEPDDLDDDDEECDCGEPDCPDCERHARRRRRKPKKHPRR